MLVKRGEIYYADLSPVVGSEQGGVRPVLIVQNDVGNRHSPTVIAAAITSRREKAKLPTHIDVQAATCGLTKDSVVLLEQIRTLDKRRLKDRMGRAGRTVHDAGRPRPASQFRTAALKYKKSVHPHRAYALSLCKMKFTFAYFAAFSFFASWDFLRAAAFLCIRPFAQA